MTSGNRVLWLATGAFICSVIALIVALTSGGDSAAPDTAGATGEVGPTATSRKPTPSTDEAPTDTAEPSAPSTTPATGSTPGATPGGGAGSAKEVSCPAATVSVNDADSLEEALADAGPGDSIGLADGTYEGRFEATTPGTADQPVFVCGGLGAVIDGGGTDGGYGFHLDGAAHWRLVGFTVRNSQKGVMADRVQGSVIQGLTVEQIGDEAIHLRNFSTDNVVLNNTVRDTGQRKEKFGEGVYIGSAESNWCTVSDCKPDASDRNVISGNDISATTAESIDIKEGTSGGKVIGNTFDGSRLSGSHNDSWVDVKGNGWLIQGNTGRNALEDGFQTHEIIDGWGTDNTFKGNTAEVNGPGYGFKLTPVEGNKVACDNKAEGAAKGLANVDCAGS
ncbi:right-handed parallel beta-helix repeat-containing protein [Streptomyces sp. NBC_00286]|uniref:right-handed parallel beta-helix repeat-containing protein n=1 Tax=Streptomyces sp. NBC_00286 TaxID=2975701 RepID=UPI002E2E0A3C|nr:right-handed parallel beta-helix repeat-containing protein [Streptomyces sp. NBC_00286]